MPSYGLVHSRTVDVEVTAYPWIWLPQSKFTVADVTAINPGNSSPPYTKNLHFARTRNSGSGDGSVRFEVCLDPDDPIALSMGTSSFTVATDSTTQSVCVQGARFRVIVVSGASNFTFEIFAIGGME